MKLKSFQLKKNQHGFTLMEVMVSVSIFALIITIGIGSLLTIYSTLKKTRADQQAMDSLSFVMDTMTRRIRTGYNYTGGGNSLSLIDQDGESIKYERIPDSVNTNLQRLFFTGSDGIPYDITPENINISLFDIEIHSNGQPMVEIHLEGTIKNGRDETPLALQTIVSQRPFISGSNSLLTPTADSSTAPDTAAASLTPTDTTPIIKDPTTRTFTPALGDGAQFRLKEPVVENPVP